MRDAEDSDAGDEAELEVSLQRVQEGGIPLSAERRLLELRDGGGSFTSDLSVSAFALCHQLGLQVISQVMGSSIYQMGYQGLGYQGGWGTPMGGSILTEMPIVSEAWNEARRLALNHLELEANHAGADAVVGVELRTGAHDWAAESIEYVVLGTAVRREGAPASAQPVMTELSVSDYANLARAGIEPVGIVAWTSVFFAAYENNWILEPNRLNPTQNYELREFTAGVYSAREQTMERLGLQAQQLGASGIVGVRIGHTVNRQDVGAGNRQRGGVLITFDAIGTAVRETAAASFKAPQTTVDLSI
ncbi:MAG: heavy metal-binding domain-containing protein [Solirubrobacteraceae bacterium]